MKWFDISSKKFSSDDKYSEGDYADEMESHDGVRKFMEVSVDGEDDGVQEESGLKLFFTISTDHIDRDGDTIEQSGWDLSEYKKNPVVLWAHDSSAPPVAKANATYLAPSVSKASGEESVHLMSVAEFPSKDLYPFGNMVGRLYKNGYLHGASVGFLPMDYEINREREGFSPVDFKTQKLLEWSAVPVPSNPEGLVQARSSGIDLAPMVTWAEKILDGEGSLILPRHLLEEVRKNASSKVFILNKDSSIQLDMFRVEENFSDKVEEQVKSFTEDAHEHFTHEEDVVEESHEIETEEKSADAEEMASSVGEEEAKVETEEKELTLDESQAKEADSQDEVETNDDDLRRLAQATFERRVLSLTQELKSLVGEISRGVDR